MFNWNGSDALQNTGLLCLQDLSTVIGGHEMSDVTKVKSCALKVTCFKRAADLASLKKSCRRGLGGGVEMHSSFHNVQ